MQKSKLVLTMAAAMMFGAALCASAQNAPTPAPAPGAVAPVKPDRVMGAVTATDPTANSVTINERDGSAVTFTVDPSAKIWVHSVSTTADISATDRLRIMSATDIDDGATTVTAASIYILPAAVANAKHTGSGYKGKHVDGDVVTLSPLTIKTDGGVTVAVTASETTPVQLDKPGSFTDIAVGTRVMAVVTGDAPSLVAKLIHVMPGGVKHGHKAKA